MNYIYGANITAADNIRNLFFGTLGSTCFYFESDLHCIKYEDRCTQSLIFFESCTTICIVYAQKYAGKEGRAKTGQIEAVPKT